jgi:NADPH:quinone reductase-like Zn-dependent oxidoreductase
MGWGVSVSGAPFDKREKTRRFPAAYYSYSGQSHQKKLVTVGMGLTDPRSVSGSQLAATHIPPSVSFAQASVVPSAIASAAVGLFPEDKLNLPFPSSEQTSTQWHTVVIWGGSSSVGSLAIQLAHASGAHVITTASKRSHAYVTELGADEVFDHSSPSIVDDLVKAVKARGVQGFVGVYDAISHEDTIRASVAVVSRTKGKGIVVATLPQPPEGLPDGVEVKMILALEPGQGTRTQAV